MSRIRVYEFTVTVRVIGPSAEQARANLDDYLKTLPAASDGPTSDGLLPPVALEVDDTPGENVTSEYSKQQLAKLVPEFAE